MPNENITPGNIGDAIISALSEYSDDVAEGTKKAVDLVTKEVMFSIKAHVSFTSRTGKYIGAFREKTSFEDKRNKRNTWYVNKPHYRLMHLLEYGHKTHKNSWTRSFPHIIYGEEIAQLHLPIYIEKVIKGESL
jgi:hypothetical protein